MKFISIHHPAPSIFHVLISFESLLFRYSHFHNLYLYLLLCNLKKDSKKLTLGSSISLFSIVRFCDIYWIFLRFKTENIWCLFFLLFLISPLREAPPVNFMKVAACFASHRDHRFSSALLLSPLTLQGCSDPGNGVRFTEPLLCNLTCK